MATKQELQDLLRFLTKDAKLPLAQAMSKVKPLQDASLSSPSTIAQVSITRLSPIFGSEAAAKPVLLAAKRVTKKRTAEDASLSTTSKRARTSQGSSEPTDGESSLALPISDASEAQLAGTVLVTNRAPLVLAFAAVVLERTMPRQPLGSRLSLAQAVVSLNSRSKAQSIGLESGRSAEEDGWGMGTQKVTVLGRQVSAMKRGADESLEENATTQQAQSSSHTNERNEAGLWGLDLEAMRAKNSSVAPTASAALPIYRPEAARAYLLRSFSTQETPEDNAEASSTKSSKKKKTKAMLEAEKEENCARLLKAIRLLCDSWEKLAPHELDRRAWTWYVAVRPEVSGGVAGWGAKNVVKLKDILDLKRQNQDVS